VRQRLQILTTRFASLSPSRGEMRTRLCATTGQAGCLSQLNVNLKNPPPSRHPFFGLRYGKRSSLVLPPLLYPSAAPCLERKRAKWIAYAQCQAIIG
jgi:hypothetical protein